MLAWRDATEGLLRVAEYIEDGTLVVRADAPGIDPDNDLEVTASEGYLHIAAERPEGLGGLSTLAGWGTFSGFGATLHLVEHLRIT